MTPRRVIGRGNDMWIQVVRISHGSARRRVTRAPRAGTSAVPCRRTSSRWPPAGSSVKFRTTWARISRSSSSASEAPRQRRSPPPNGSHVRGSGRRSRNRSAMKLLGSRCSQRWISGGAIRRSRWRRALAAVPDRLGELADDVDERWAQPQDLADHGVQVRVLLGVGLGRQRADRCRVVREQLQRPRERGRGRLMRRQQQREQLVGDLRVVGAGWCSCGHAEPIQGVGRTVAARTACFAHLRQAQSEAGPAAPRRCLRARHAEPAKPVDAGEHRVWVQRPAQMTLELAGRCAAVDAEQQPSRDAQRHEARPRQGRERRAGRPARDLGGRDVANDRRDRSQRVAVKERREHATGARWRSPSSVRIVLPGSTGRMRPFALPGGSAPAALCRTSAARSGDATTHMRPASVRRGKPSPPPRCASISVESGLRWKATAWRRPVTRPDDPTADRRIP